MPQEIKMRLQDYKLNEKHLESLGAKFIEELNAQDTYFNCPEDEVLKITEDENGNFIVKLKRGNGKFQITQYDKIEDIENIKKELSLTNGLKCVLKKKRRFFSLKGYDININLIEGIGDFLIVEGENLSLSTIKEDLELEDIEIIDVSFDKLVK